jgi:hypothetical protein
VSEAAAASASVTPTRYGPPLWRPIAFAAAAAACAVATVVLPALWAPAAVLVLAAARDLWCRPALSFGPDGLRYVSGLHRERAKWNEVSAIRVRHERHFLAFGHHVEIDLTDETLVVLSSLQLGAPAEAVAAELEAAWQHAVRSARPSWPGSQPPE